MKDGKIVIAAVRAPASRNAVPRLAVAVVIGDKVARSEIDLGGAEREEISKIASEEWAVSVRSEKVARKSWLRVEAIGRAGEDLFTAQGVVTFFAFEDGELRHIWTGMGSRAETRFDACRIDTVASFKLLPGDVLQRTRRTTKDFVDPGGSSDELTEGLKEECVASPAKRDEFRLGSGG